MVNLKYVSTEKLISELKRRGIITGDLVDTVNLDAFLHMLRDYLVEGGFIESAVAIKEVMDFINEATND